MSKGPAMGLWAQFQGGIHAAADSELRWRGGAPRPVGKGRMPPCSARSRSRRTEDAPRQVAYSQLCFPRRGLVGLIPGFVKPDHALGGFADVRPIAVLD